MAVAPSLTIWDYSGIVAAAYDQFFGDEPYWDQRFFEQRLRANGGRALELACGTGRLLLPLLRDGIEVEGLDTSADMLAILHAKAQRLALAPRTYLGAMQAFDLTARYRTVFEPAGTFGILVHASEVEATLACCLKALEPGGELLLPVATEAPLLTESEDWRLRREVDVPGHAAHLKIFEQWHATPDAMVNRWSLRYEVAFADRPPETFGRSHLLRRYAPAELEQRLAAAGFVGITMRRGYADSPSDAREDDLIFAARRPH